MRSYDQSTNPRWSELLHKAVTEPGVISKAFSRFHQYSFGNQLLSVARGILSSTWEPKQNRGAKRFPLEPGTHTEPVLAHVLFMDIVGCSKLPSDEQKRIVGRLQELVRASAEFQRSRDSDQLISLPTGDGMALAFFNKLDAAVQCALEVTKSIQAESLCQIRMGVNTGPVFIMEDINHKSNISGAGINRAERVMSCGEDGHILLSGNVAESLRHLSNWRDKIHEIGQCQVKDGWTHVWSLVDGAAGNPAVPKRSKRRVRRRRQMIAAGVAVLALTVAASAFWLGRLQLSPELSMDQASTAVLPFADISPEKNQEYFSDGLAEELLNELAKIPGLRVAGRTSSFQFKNKAGDPRLIGEKLKVASLLEGSVRIQGNRASISVHLIRAADGIYLWSQQFDRELNDILAVQEEIARAVTGALKITLLDDKTASPSAKRANADAYNAYLQGLYFFRQHNKGTREKAVGYFNQASKLDPAFALAWLGLGESRISQADAADIPPREGYRMAREAVEKALALNPKMGEAYAALGYIKMFRDWDWEGADASYQRALALEPGNVTVIMGAGTLAKTLGRLDEAVARDRLAIANDPLSTSAHHNFGIALLFAGRLEEARVEFQKALELAPDRTIEHCLLSEVHLIRSHAVEALAEAEKEKYPAYRLWGLALASHALGRKKDSDTNLEQLIEKFQADEPFAIAEVYAFRRQPNQAFEWLERAYKQPDSGLAEIKGEPLLKSLEYDPRYKDLLKRMRLPN
jgi:TolB-like protein/class 3 adenylate cyclase/Tfp pilus assembly protein PilF